MMEEAAAVPLHHLPVVGYQSVNPAHVGDLAAAEIARVGSTGGNQKKEYGKKRRR
jgi:hypothetical protein